MNENLTLSKETTRRIKTANRLNRFVDITQYEAYGNLPTVLSSSLRVNNGEYPIYVTLANVIKQKEQTVGYTGKSAGVSVRVAKGVTLRQGASKGTPVKRDVNKFYTGELVITNQRIVFIAEREGFDIKLSQITAYKAINKNSILIQTARTSKKICVNQALFAYLDTFMKYAIDLSSNPNAILRRPEMNSTGKASYNSSATNFGWGFLRWFNAIIMFIMAINCFIIPSIPASFAFILAGILCVFPINKYIHKKATLVKVLAVLVFMSVGTGLMAEDETTNTIYAVDANNEVEELTEETESVEAVTEEPTIMLGNFPKSNYSGEEGTTCNFTCYATPTDLNADTIQVVLSDSNIASISDLSFSNEGNKTVITYNVNFLSVGTSELMLQTVDGSICSNITKITVKEKDNSRTVYSTPTGSKYHLSSSCAGKNARATTENKALNAGLTPCGKCAK